MASSRYPLIRMSHISSTSTGSYREPSAASGTRTSSTNASPTEGQCGGESDPEEDPPDEIERSRSYHTFFISPDGEGVTFETETEGVTEPGFMTDDFTEAGWGEEPPVSRVSGSGRTGWIVAVSLLAPFAVIELGDIGYF